MMPEVLIHLDRSWFERLDGFLLKYNFLLELVSYRTKLSGHQKEQSTCF